ncbi:MAG: hypothetical protein KGN16_13250 [Burkholderiales bacterium]|nr:hypothetical protein [Burkholderiales bacterium]
MMKQRPLRHLRPLPPVHADAPWQQRLIDLLRGRDPAWRNQVSGRSPEALPRPSSYGLLVRPH